jgi:hypothetical protein
VGGRDQKPSISGSLCDARFLRWEEGALSPKHTRSISERGRPFDWRRRFARRQEGCKALMGHYGVGPRVATAMLAEFGDARRFSSS